MIIHRIIEAYFTDQSLYILWKHSSTFLPLQNDYSQIRVDQNGFYDSKNKLIPFIKEL